MGPHLLSRAISCSTSHLHFRSVEDYLTYRLRQQAPNIFVHNGNRSHWQTSQFGRSEGRGAEHFRDHNSTTFPSINWFPATGRAYSGAHGESALLKVNGRSPLERRRPSLGHADDPPVTNDVFVDLILLPTSSNITQVSSFPACERWKYIISLS